MNKENNNRIKKQAEEFRKEVRKNTITAISAGLAFVIALFWRDAIQQAIDRILISLNLTQDAYIYKILAALIVTILAVMGIVLLARFDKKEIKEDKN